MYAEEKQSESLRTWVLNSLHCNSPVTYHLAGEAARQGMFFRGGVRKAYFVWRLLRLNRVFIETRRVCEFNTIEYAV